MELANKVANQPVVGAFGDDFDTIACRKNHCFIHRLTVHKRRQSRTKSIITERQPLTNFYRRCFVTKADQC